MLVIDTPAGGNKVHWNYFLALERDLELASRYVEFSPSNMSVYSIEFAHVLLAASSEVDVLAKLLCERLAPTAPRGNIDQYRAVLVSQITGLISEAVFAPRYSLELLPWDTWANSVNPPWWRSYNNVKHQRDSCFSEATLENALTSMAALLTLVVHYYSLTLSPPGTQRLETRLTTSSLQPQSSLLRLSNDSYVHALMVG
jgi:hypothetical protein